MIIQVYDDHKLGMHLFGYSMSIIGALYGSVNGSTGFINSIRDSNEFVGSLFFE